jgi:hypothetical protein
VRDPRPVLTATEPWERGSVAGPVAVWDGQASCTWYSVGLNEGIGYAWSVDGVSWEKSVANPVFPRGSDSVFAYLDGDECRVLYGHFDLESRPPVRGIGMAILRLRAGDGT